MTKNLRAIAFGSFFACSVVICSPQVDRDYSARHPVSAVPPALRIDINHATIDELFKVPGMKRTWAQRVVRFRPYRTKQDLLDEGIVPSDVYSRIQGFIIAHKEKQ